MTRLCLTIDDAPSVDEPGVSFELSRMDRMREALEADGWRDCCAFVIGSRADPPALERWLQAGFALGNHSWDHVPATRAGADAFLDSAGKCDRRLEELGAFEHHPKWFRFPHLDRGSDADARSRIQSGLEELGYELAPASVEVHDHLFDPRFEGARDADEAQAVLNRYLSVARRSLDAEIQARKRNQVSAPSIAYVHFGPVSQAAFPRLLGLLRDLGFVEASLGEALGDPFYRAMLRDFEWNGLVKAQARAGLARRVLRRANKLGLRAGLFDQGRLGDLWPYL
ncbi:MAG: polysaccharide deacetylase family protein [Myxococcota bacterium]